MRIDPRIKLTANMLEHSFQRLLRCLRTLWASPNTVLAITAGLLLSGRFRLVDGVIEVHGIRVARVLNAMFVPARAMTIGHVVFGENQAALDQTRQHERVHVRQYERWGPFFLPAYLGCSFFLWLRGRDAYRENPFEIEAYAMDDCGLGKR